MEYLYKMSKVLLRNILVFPFSISVFGLLLLFSISIFGCGRYDKQYSNIINENSTKLTTVQCQTLFGIPYLCLVQEDTDTDVIEYIKVVEYITVKEFIEVIVEKTVIEKEYVPYEVIVEKFVEKIEYVNVPYSLPQAVADAVEIVKEVVPQQYVSNATPQSVATSVIASIPEIKTYNPLPPPPTPTLTLPPPPPPLTKKIVIAANGDETTYEGHKEVRVVTQDDIDNDNVDNVITGEEWGLNAQDSHYHTYTHTEWVQEDFEEYTHTHTHGHRHTIRDGKIGHGSIINTEHENHHTHGRDFVRQ